MSSFQYLSDGGRVRYVSFSPYVVINEVLHVDDFDDNEIDDYWYYEEEYFAMREDIYLTAKMIMEHKFINEDTHSIRGIENQVGEGRMRRQHARASSISAILTEQESQRRRPFTQQAATEVDYLSVVYRQHTQVSQLQAYLNGIADEQVARQHNPAFFALKKRRRGGASQKREIVYDQSPTPKQLSKLKVMPHSGSVSKKKNRLPFSASLFPF